MITNYPTIYRDKHGEEHITIESTGTSLRTVIRGVEFIGEMFDDFEPLDTEDSKLTTFTLDRECLTACKFQSDIPVLVVADNVPRQAVLRVQFDLAVREEALILTLIYDKNLFKSAGKSYGYFEEELVDIFKQLPENTYLKICLFCAFSQFIPGGNGAFGCLACFRDNKEGIRAVRNKADLFRVMDTMTEYVQETHLCPEFERYK